jgi:Heterokaryon incompatibility protein (HET)
MRAVHKPLPLKSSIRLLHIKPGKISDPLICSLHVADLRDDTLSYEALSYAWGDRSTVFPILCNGIATSVQVNLRDALQRLRLEGERRTLWVDALCINQNDVSERGSQVKLMQQIYQRAVRVLIWIGHQDSEYAELGFAAICGIVNSWRAVRGRRPASYLSTQRCSAPSKISEQGPDYADESTWEAIRVLFRQPYWTRLWVLQEVVASSLAIVIWGDAEIAWTWVGLAISVIRNNGKKWQSYSIHENGALLNAYLMFRLPDPNFLDCPLSFLDLLRMTLKFNASEASDRIFAILGLPGDHSGADGNPFIEPNYSLSLGSLHMRVAERILETHATPLDLLSAVHHKEAIDFTFPTWVPRWNVQGIRGIVGSHRPGMKFAASQGFQRGSHFKFQGTFPNSILNIQGIKIGVISSSTDTFLQDDLHCSKPMNMMRKSLKNLNIDLQNRDIAEVLASTLTAGQDWYGDLVRKSEQHFADFVAFSIDYWNISLPRSREPGSSARFLSAVRNVCAGRRVFHTCERRLGLGPGILQKGDLICVFLGGTVPYVIRPITKSTYCLVGECYVNGYMFGEAIKEWKDGKRRVQQFPLQ